MGNITEYIIKKIWLLHANQSLIPNQAHNESWVFLIGLAHAGLCCIVHYRLGSEHTHIGTLHCTRRAPRHTNHATLNTSALS